MKRLILSLFLTLPSCSSAADVYIGVDGAVAQSRESVALNNFSASRTKPDKENEAQAAAFRETVRGDLMFSRYFDIKEDTGDTQDRTENEAAEYWAAAAKYMITGTLEADGVKWTFSGRIYDLQTQSVIMEKRYRGNVKALRLSAHMFADAATEKITGRRGIAHSRITFANDSTGHKEIYVSDYDGQNLRKLTSDKSINLLPRWSQDSGRIYYTTYRYGNPDMSSHISTAIRSLR